MSRSVLEDHSEAERSFERFIVSGEKIAFDEFVTHTTPMLRSFRLKRIHPSDDNTVDDLLQETFIELLRYSPPRLLVLPPKTGPDLIGE